ncbi:peptide ABC transporter ATP-binding protein [Weissella oryzae SG25]|uniref:Peptide ABC transporter ATP-binding protein n=1 Tax=Weissella oryzae (strain DSM 25784 / JCM 18191 / LMG 30913 / SG25) TaxID=1329250 RepID=A0A069CVC8_WEIOS|nr:ABC transporter permease [Weissella oryzae]GAK31183.1 peptide ABC transporter ATP-binding protein [Weissella oryzae SG25]
MFNVAIKSLKSRWRDFTVLFVGLVLAIAIFYMFTALATNESFLHANSSISLLGPVFTVGEFLLGVITFVYLNFANSFLLQIRQSEYGLISMLGARKSQIGALLFIETILLGLVALVIGLAFGLGLTALSSTFLLGLLDIQVQHWSSFSLGALIDTSLFFIALFILNGFINTVKLRRVDTITLLNANHTAKQPKVKPLSDIIVGLLGLIILSLSFVLMIKINDFGSVYLAVFVTIIILNIWGTYLFLSRTLKLVLLKLRETNFIKKSLRPFINGQTLFRLSDYQKILTAISVIFALALGAVSVGQAFQVLIPQQAQGSSPITAAYTSKNVDLSKLNDLTWSNEYHYVIRNNVVYFNVKEINTHKVPTIINPESDHPRTKWLSGDAMLENPGTEHTLRDVAGQLVKYSPTTYTDFKAKLLPDDLALGQQGDVKTVTLIRVNNLINNQDILKKNQAIEIKATGVNDQVMAGNYSTFNMLKSFSGGLEFMGFFLGIGFLAMLASTLMFKILSSVSTDKHRYEILRMIGANKQVIRRTIATDIGILFMIPLLIGTIDVLFGLKMFELILHQPYAGLLSAMISMYGIYFIYYVITIVYYIKLTGATKGAIRK